MARAAPEATRWCLGVNGRFSKAACLAAAGKHSGMDWSVSPGALGTSSAGWCRSFMDLSSPAQTLCVPAS